MNQNNLKFDKSVKRRKNTNNQVNVKSMDSSKRMQIKRQIILKYGVSDLEAERILRRIEQKYENTNNNISNDEKWVNGDNSNLNKNISNVNTLINSEGNNSKKFKSNNHNHEKLNVNKKWLKVSSVKVSDKPNIDQHNFNNKNASDVFNNKHINSENTKNNDLNQNSHYFDKVNRSKNDIIRSNSDENTKLHSQNVDDIISDIIPDYNSKVVIELDHADLTFEVLDEKIDTLKEKFIKTFKRNNTKKFKIHALNDISFKIYKGEKVGIIGYNGAGKSTLLKVICGIYPTDSGEVYTHGHISPLLTLGSGFDHNYSGRRNIFFNGAVLGYEKSFLESKLDEIIDFSELGEYIDIPIKNYSSGMLAKLSFSIATAVEPDILIIDEVLGVGDATFARKSRDKIRSIMGGETTVLLVSHSIAQVREICDKAIWIDNGKVREMGEVNKICDHYLKDAEKASNEQLANIQLR